LTAPANGATLSVGSTVNITATASDTQSTISKVEFYVDGVLTGTVTTSPYTFPWNTTGVSLASHTIMAKAYDSPGNVAASATITVTVADKTAPTAVTNFRTTSLNVNAIGLAWNASTDNIGVVNYKLSRNGTLIATLTPTTLSYSDTGLSAATTYSYSITASDAAGNTSTATTLSAATSALIPGDVNADGTVDQSDLTLLIANYGTNFPAADFNKSGLVDVGDLSTLLSHYGQ
jgi:chitinase